MGAYLEVAGAAQWSTRAEELQGADPSQLPGRKLVAESCLVDLLAPMMAETSPIPEHLELMARAGWCGWFNGHVDSSPGVVPPDARTVSRYASELRTLTADILPPLLRQQILRLFLERPESGDRPVNATSIKKVLSARLPWIHRELVNRYLNELAEEGWLQSTTRGYRLVAGARARALPEVSAEVSLAECFQDVYPSLTAYVDLQSGAIAGLAEIILTPDRLRSLSAEIDQALEASLAPYEEAAKERPAERRMVLQLHRLSAPADDAGQAPQMSRIGAGASDLERDEANAEARLLGPLVAVSALPGWGDPDEAWRGLKGAIALHLQRALVDSPGGLYRAAHRYHGIGYGTLASYLDGPVLISRNNGKIRAVREGEAGRLERETLVLLSQVYPQPRSERWLWEHLSENAEVLSYQDYRALLVKMARDGFVLMSKAGASRCYRMPRSFQAVPVSRMWDRWQNLWRWLPALRRVSRAIRRGEPGATIGRGRWVVDREDLPVIEAQIQREVGVLIRSESERCAHLEEIDHLSVGGRKSHIVIFTRQEPWLLAQMEDPWDEAFK